ncbi:Cof-type HAD-IIB family hydrolase [Streptococcus cuniculipharyngis]|uniref:Cof-type HAD-IIB family hydrolase n=1 Tax=Streptococcus cuniculipharyngis TaxID=1562651 RepID=A0A5C5S8B5_9STRE|nr:Cof-type HAD-IIB family hydrolase [Streptococcus cuniculipharyngis]TWS96461.1 Cof-type HAD-IIB family hydrolase [Streptococcus cuniculipharyngis]
MAIKAVCFDIDGTLLNDIKSVQKSTQKAIKELHQQGILVGVATGRGPSFINRFMENLELDFAVSYNGQYIFTRDQVIYANALSKKDLYRVIKYASNKRREISLGTETGLVGSNIINMGTSRFGQLVSRLIPKEWARTVQRSFKHVVRRIKPQNHSNLLTIVQKPIYQVVLVATKEETQVLREKFPQLTITRSSPYSADLIAKNMSKLAGIRRVGRYFGFDVQEVMAFGDSDNDLEMLAGVGIGVAMGNGTEEAKKAAAYTTSSNNQDGIAKALAHYGLIHLENDINFSSSDDNFNKVRDFHELMDGRLQDIPQAFDPIQASHRANFKIEELVEFLYASQTSSADFEQSIASLHRALDQAVAKVKQTPPSKDALLGQVDALADLLYFSYGSFTLMGVDPKPIFDSVHEANMGKVFPDGKAHFDPATGKILKPADWHQHFAPEPAISLELDRQIRKAQARQKQREQQKED